MQTEKADKQMKYFFILFAFLIMVVGLSYIYAPDKAKGSEQNSISTELDEKNTPPETKTQQQTEQTPSDGFLKPL